MKASIAVSDGLTNQCIQMEQSSDENDAQFLKRFANVISFMDDGKVVENG